MKLTWLAVVLRDAGLTVVEEPHWRTRGRHWTSGNPVGAMQHHTAAPVPFPTKKLYGLRIKANLQSRTDGTIHVIAAGRCNYSSGRGSSVVLSETRRSIAPPDTARARGLADNTGGNSRYVNCEADHLGTGGPMPAVQERAIVVMWQAIFTKLEWASAKLIGHTEWTRRKVDPLWNGSVNRTPTLRAMMLGDLPPIEEEDMLPLLYGDGFNKAPIDSGFPGANRAFRRDDVKNLQLKVGLTGNSVDGWYGNDTAGAVALVIPNVDGRFVGGDEWHLIETLWFSKLGGAHPHPFASGDHRHGTGPPL